MLHSRLTVDLSQIKRWGGEGGGGASPMLVFLGECLGKIFIIHKPSVPFLGRYKFNHLRSKNEDFCHHCMIQ